MLWLGNCSHPSVVSRRRNHLNIRWAEHFNSRGGCGTCRSIPWSSLGTHQGGWGWRTRLPREPGQGSTLYVSPIIFPGKWPVIITGHLPFFLFFAGKNYRFFLLQFLHILSCIGGFYFKVTKLSFYWYLPIKKCDTCKTCKYYSHFSNSVEPFSRTGPY